MDDEITQDNIDSYLAGEMSQEQILWFENEVKKSEELTQLVAYNRKLYEEIEVWGKGKLRGRLDEYYEEYLSEKEEDENDAVIIPFRSKEDSNGNKNTNKGLPRWLLGVAASVAVLVLVGLLFYSKEKESGQIVIDSDETEESGNIVKSDDKEETQPIGKEDKQKTEAEKEKYPPTGIKPNPILPKSSYSLSGMKQLQEGRIRSIIHPLALTYTYQNATLTLFGDPLIPPLRIKIFRQGSDKYLQYKGAYFPIRPTTTAKKMIPVSLSIDHSVATEEAVNIVLANLQQSPSIMATLEVWFGNSPQRTYHFDGDSNDRKLIIHGQFEEKSLHVFIVNNTSYYLLSGEQVFKLDPAQSTPKRLVRMNSSLSSEARLFEENRKFTRKVYKSE